MVDKLRVFFNHPLFVETIVERVAQSLESIPPDRRGSTRLVFTAHSIPQSMAVGCQYEAQLRETCDLVVRGVGAYPSALVYQSRSGPPSQPWLEPDVRDHLRQLAAEGGVTDVVLVPVGFLSDHMEVVYDLDHEALQLGRALGLHVVRSATPGNHPRVIQMIRELIVERTARGTKRLWGGWGRVMMYVRGTVVPLAAQPAGARAAI